jgi:hypothetical protein
VPNHNLLILHILPLIHWILILLKNEFPIRHSSNVLSLDGYGSLVIFHEREHIHDSVSENEPTGVERGTEVERASVIRGVKRNTRGVVHRVTCTLSLRFCYVASSDLSLTF